MEFQFWGKGKKGDSMLGIFSKNKKTSTSASMNNFKENISIQRQIEETGLDILKRCEDQKMSLFSKDYWYGSVMDWSMKNESFKTQLFRFVDVLPSLESSQEVSRHLKEYFTDSGEELPKVFTVGMGLGSLAPGLMAQAIKKNVMSMAKMFIAGENPQELLTSLREIRKNGMSFTVDILGETTLSEKEALTYQKQYLELIDSLAAEAKTWRPLDCEKLSTGETVPLVNVSVKLTALYSQIKETAWETTKAKIKERLRPLYLSAAQKGLFLNLDMEHYGVKTLTLEVFQELLMEPKLKNYPHFGCVIQAYLRDSGKDVENLIEFAKIRNTPFTIRLVKGAYWDFEKIDAEQKNWDIPVYTVKAESDSNYEKLAGRLLANFNWVKLAVGSHNVRTLAACLVMAKKYGVQSDQLEFQMLYGMADPIKKSIRELGYRVREYTPMGELIPGMAYLVRRLLENTSNESWLRSKFVENKNPIELLKDPSEGLTPSSPKPQIPGFNNHPPSDFTLLEVRQKMLRGLAHVEAQLPMKIPSVLGGKTIYSGEFLTHYNPSESKRVVTLVSQAETQALEEAVHQAAQYVKVWSKEKPEVRAEILERMANLVDEKRFELMALEVFEVGKPWQEADSDINEAIDFCRFYAQEMRKLSKPKRVGRVPGEVSMYQYQARGVTVVIAPWNFPLAILCGMTAAALVTGNTVVIKPAEQSSAIAYEMFKLFRKAGIPSEALQFAPGKGEVVGDYLVRHPFVSTVAFTGSKVVGLSLLNAASLRQPGQNQVKRCILEMGGKNAIILDNDADLDEAIGAVLYSAFGFAGQKCSACSRLIVLEEVYEKALGRLIEGAKSLEVTAAKNPEAFLGPVIDQEAYERLKNIVTRAKIQFRLCFEGEVSTEGYFISPTIFADVPADSWFAQEEFFGPILAIIKVKDMDEAIKVANSTEYALTGGVFSRSPKNIERVKNELECGNLYINRSITGAMVDRHPFGGYKMSGIGSKTGGFDYLLQFMEPKVVTENTLRRGFAPLEEDI